MADRGKGRPFHPSRIAPEVKPGIFQKGAMPLKGWLHRDDRSPERESNPLWKKAALLRTVEEKKDDLKRVPVRGNVRAGGGQEKESVALEDFDRTSTRLLPPFQDWTWI